MLLIEALSKTKADPVTAERIITVVLCPNLQELSIMIGGIFWIVKRTVSGRGPIVFLTWNSQLWKGNKPNFMIKDSTSTLSDRPKPKVDSDTVLMNSNTLPRV